MNFRSFLHYLAFAVMLALLSVSSTIPASAQPDDKGEGQLINEPPKGITPEQVIQRFAAREKHVGIVVLGPSEPKSCAHSPMSVQGVLEVASGVLPVSKRGGEKAEEA